MEQKLRIREVLIVEGRYDATILASFVDGLILTTDGFSIFKDPEKKALIQELGKKRGLIILTDSDAAGFQIRSYLQKIANGCAIKNAYIPAVAGKERRKALPSKEGTLGVEGLPRPVLVQALQQAGVTGSAPRAGREITYTDLYELGLSGGPGSAGRRRELLNRVGLPQRLSKKALAQVLSSLYTFEEVQHLLDEKPALYWDFHGTLTTRDLNWFDCTLEAARERVPAFTLDPQVLHRHLSGCCLPWWTVPSRDTRHLTKPGAWWEHCEKEFVDMFQKCGYSLQQAEDIAPYIRGKILEPERYRLKPDAVQTLSQLQKRGYRHFIISNNFPELGEIVTDLGLDPYLSGVFVSGIIGFDKPRPEIFEYARAQAGNPAQNWMIGDNPQDDIEGAKTAGFTTVIVENRSSAHADYTVDSLAEILNILQ